MSPAIAAVLVLAAVACGFAIDRLVRVPRPPRRRRRVVSAEIVPVELQRTERLLTGTIYAGDLHRRLRPVLREIARARLSLRGVAVDDDPGQARTLLGETLWEIVDSGRPSPTDSYAPGLSAAALRHVIERLESL